MKLTMLGNKKASCIGEASLYYLVGDKGIEPLQRASKAPALPLCKSPITKKPTSI